MDETIKPEVEQEQINPMIRKRNSKAVKRLVMRSIAMQVTQVLYLVLRQDRYKNVISDADEHSVKHIIKKLNNYNRELRWELPTREQIRDDYLELAEDMMELMNEPKHSDIVEGELEHEGQRSRILQRALYNNYQHIKRICNNKLFRVDLTKESYEVDYLYDRHLRFKQTKYRRVENDQ